MLDSSKSALTLDQSISNPTSGVTPMSKTYGSSASQSKHNLSSDKQRPSTGTNRSQSRGLKSSIAPDRQSVVLRNFQPSDLNQTSSLKQKDLDQHRNHTLTPNDSAPVLKTSSQTPTTDTMRTSARHQVSPPKIMTQGALSVNSFRLTTMSSINN